MSTGKAFAVQLAPTFTPVAPSVAVKGAVASLGKVAAAVTPVALGAAAAAGAVFLTRAALRGLAALDVKEMRAAGEMAANRAEVRAWDEVFAEVMIRNTRIVRLRETAASALPEPFVYRCETHDQIRAWCRTVDEKLADAERQATAARWQAALARRVSEPAEFVRRRVERSLLRRAPTPEPTRPSTPQPQPQPPKPAPPVPAVSTTDRQASPQPVIDDILGKAAGNMSPDDFAQLTEKAAEVLAQNDLRATKAELDELYLMADRARRAQERRASDALLAAQWLVGLAPLADQPTVLSPYQVETLDALRAVVAERRELDPALREAAVALVELAMTVADDVAISKTFARELEALGYTVDVTDGGVAHPPHVRATRPEWGDAHRATVDVRSGSFDAAFTTLTADPVGRPDLHKAEWAEDVAKAKRRVAEQGVWSGKLVMSDDPRPHARRDDADAEADQDIRASRPHLQERPTPTC